MNQRKFDRLLREQNAPAKKVFEAVPLQEAWSPEEVIGEMRRTGHRLEMHVVRGCLNTLKKAGLIKEPNKNTFTRVSRPFETPSKPTLHLAVPVDEPFTIQPEVDMTQFDLLRAKLTNLDKYVTETTEHIRQDIKDTLHHIDETELRCMEQQESNTEELDKLRNLAAAIKGLS